MLLLRGSSTPGWAAALGLRTGRAAASRRRVVCVAAADTKRRPTARLGAGLPVRRIVVAAGAEQDSGELVALSRAAGQELLGARRRRRSGTISVPLGPLGADEGGAAEQLLEERRGHALGLGHDRIGVDELQVEVASV